MIHDVTHVISSYPPGRPVRIRQEPVEEQSHEAEGEAQSWGGQAFIILRFHHGEPSQDLRLHPRCFWILPTWHWLRQQLSSRDQNSSHLEEEEESAAPSQLQGFTLHSSGWHYHWIIKSGASHLTSNEHGQQSVTVKRFDNTFHDQPTIISCWLSQWLKFTSVCYHTLPHLRHVYFSTATHMKHFTLPLVCDQKCQITIQLKL